VFGLVFFDVGSSSMSKFCHTRIKHVEACSKQSDSELGRCDYDRDIHCSICPSNSAAAKRSRITTATHFLTAAASALAGTRQGKVISYDVRCKIRAIVVTYELYRAVTFLLCCAECRRGLAMRILSVCPSVRLSHA